MIARKTLLFAGSGASLLVALATVAVLVGPAKANKTPVTPQQLEAYDQVFMDEVRKGDLLFHGDDATAEADGGQTHQPQRWPARCAIPSPPTPIRKRSPNSR